MMSTNVSPQFADMFPSVINMGRFEGKPSTHRNRHNRGKSAGDPAGEEEIKSDLVAGRFVQIGRGMPWVNRGGPGDGLLAARQMLDDICELAIRPESPDIEFVDRVPHAVSPAGRTVRVTGIGRLRHPYAEISYRDHPGNQLQRNGPASAVRDACY